MLEAALEIIYQQGPTHEQGIMRLHLIGNSTWHHFPLGLIVPGMTF
jgi:hypothetical protein